MCSCVTSCVSVSVCVHVLHLVFQSLCVKGSVFMCYVLCFSLCVCSCVTSCVSVAVCEGLSVHVLRLVFQSLCVFMCYILCFSRCV